MVKKKKKKSTQSNLELLWWFSSENLLAVKETPIQSSGQKYPLEEETTTHSSILICEIPWTESGGLEFIGLQRVRHDLRTKQQW